MEGIIMIKNIITSAIIIGG